MEEGKHENKKSIPGKRRKIDYWRNQMKRSIHLFVVIVILLAVSPVYGQRFYAGILGGTSIFLELDPRDALKTSNKQLLLGYAVPLDKK